MTSGLLMIRQDFARVAPWRPSKVQQISKDIGCEQFSSCKSFSTMFFTFFFLRGEGVSLQKHLLRFCVSSAETSCAGRSPDGRYVATGTSLSKNALGAISRSAFVHGHPES